jgi:hypothetical protein
MSTFTILGSDGVARVQGVLRIVAGFLFLQHATASCSAFLMWPISTICSCCHCQALRG